LSLTPVEALFSDFSLPQRILVAVSGGCDSMVLLDLCRRAAAQSGSQILAVTIDHDLRAQAATEARMVGDWCYTQNISHQIISWNGDKPKTGIQEAARHARYGLLIRAVQQWGADALLTAHHLNDQAETVFMRLKRGAGPIGLGAMRLESKIAVGASEIIKLLRPMLDISRQQLLTYAQKNNIPFVNDPSNIDDSFERVRTRALLYALEEQSLLEPQSLSLSAKRCRNIHHALTLQCNEQFHEIGGVFYRWGGIGFDGDKLNLDRHSNLLARIVYAVGAKSFLVDDQECSRAFAQMTAQKAVTFGGALIKKTDGQVMVMREPSAIIGRGTEAGPAKYSFTLEPGQKRLWDRRFILHNQSLDMPMRVKPVSRDDFDQNVSDQNNLMPAQMGVGVFLAYRHLSKEMGKIIFGGLPIVHPDGLKKQHDMRLKQVFTFKSLVEERFYGEVLRFEDEEGF